MVSITLSVPENVKHEMESFLDINWSAVAREAIMKRIIMLKKFQEFTKDSEFTQEDALKLGAEMSRKISARILPKRKK